MFMDPNGKWFFSSENGVPEGHGLGVKAHPDDESKWFSDIVIFEALHCENDDDVVAPLVKQMPKLSDKTPKQQEAEIAARTPASDSMSYPAIIEWLAEDILGSTNSADEIEANVDRYIQDLTASVQAKAEEIGV
jgi:hypothetical protein